jgi:hypothetical protein
MILPALSAGLTSDNPAVTLGSPLVRRGIRGLQIGQSVRAAVRGCEISELDGRSI